jgi:3-hydroxy-9,10-secoandrosta-1,3,5(10)-triene-9,17-dione monooxygenase
MVRPPNREGALLPATVQADSPEPHVLAAARPNAAEMQARAAALLPLLRAQQQANASRGHISDALHNQFVKAGFYRILQPRRFGGLELDYLGFARTMVMVARGDPAVALALAQSAAQAALLASYWPEQAQFELFGADGHMVAAHACLPAGSCLAVDGGYLVEGLWTDCSGAAHATHFIGSSVLHAGDARQYQARFVLDRASYTVQPRRQGQYGNAGALSVRVTRQFVAAQRVVLFSADVGAHDMEPPGLAIHPNPIYLSSGAMLAHTAAVSPMIGAALAALDEYGAIVLARRAGDSHNGRLRDERAVHGIVGRALVLVECAEELLGRALQIHRDQCVAWRRSGKPPSGDASMRVWAMLDSAGELASEATETLYLNGSSIPVGGDRRMQRYYADVQAQREHHEQLQADCLSSIGRVRLSPAERSPAPGFHR